jgi:hypothetical protein
MYDEVLAFHTDLLKKNDEEQENNKKELDGCLVLIGALDAKLRALRSQNKQNKQLNVNITNIETSREKANQYKSAQFDSVAYKKLIGDIKKQIESASMLID